MREAELIYEIDHQTFKGHLVNPTENDEKKPGILVVHSWIGRNQFVCETARQLAKLGYVGFAVDLYGEGKIAKDSEEAAAWMKPLFIDRQLLQKRILAALEVLIKQPNVDNAKIGAIGFCFGGLTVIELLRSGADVKGVVSFHGVLGGIKKDKKVKSVPIARSIKGSLLALHGYQDPFVPLEDILHLQKEMTEAGVNWQFNIYGNAGHAFMIPEENDRENGKFFEPQTCHRSWIAMENFFEEIFL
jgi:dienelactone hydrolase